MVLHLGRCCKQMSQEGEGVQMSELKYQLMLNKDMSWVPCYLKFEADKVIADLEESHKMEVGQLLMEIAELKEERRWRKFPDEKPTEEMDGMDFIVSNGFFHREISEWRGYWNNDPFCGDRLCDEVKYWRPLPVEPKEDK